MDQPFGPCRRLLLFIEQAWELVHLRVYSSERQVVLEIFFETLAFRMREPFTPLRSSPPMPLRRNAAGAQISGKLDKVMRRHAHHMKAAPPG